MKLRGLFLLLIGLPIVTWAGSVTLSWTPPSDTTGIASYQIIYGTESGKYGAPMDVPGGVTATTQVVTGLAAGKKYYFVARSKGIEAGVFSAYSNEVNANIPLAVPVGLTVTISGGN